MPRKKKAVVNIEINGWYIEKYMRPIFRKKSLVGNSPYFKKEQFPITKDLEKAFPIIRKELDVMMKRVDDFAPFHEISPDQLYISNDDKWKMFFLKAGTVKFKKNCKQFPKTIKVLEKDKNIVSAYFSVLGPNKMLMPHEGPWCGIIRIHLGLIIPKDGDGCVLICDKKEYRWEEGKCVVFDDTYEHLAVNMTDNNRVVLFLDYMRPLPKFWSFINWCIVKSARLIPYFRTPIKRHKIWEKEFYKDYG
mgnify:FL=1